MKQSISRKEYKEYLNGQYPKLAKSTKQTIITDSLYFQRHDVHFSIEDVLAGKIDKGIALMHYKKVFSNSQRAYGYANHFQYLLNFLSYKNIGSIKSIKTGEVKNVSISKRSTSFNGLLISTPNPNEMKIYHKKYEALFGTYGPAEEILDDIFNKYPSNSDYNSVLLKATLLNSFYSTNIKYMDNLVKKICGIIDFDTRVKNGDLNLVKDIEKVDKPNDGGTIDYLSFASKYCRRYNPNAFPIFDSIVSDLLCFYQNKLNVSYEIKLTKKSLRDYSTYKRTVDFFISKFIPNSSYLDFDHYLWTMGKLKLAEKNKKK